MQNYNQTKAECDWLEMAKKIENAGSTWGKRTEKAPFGPLKADNRDKKSTNKRQTRKAKWCKTQATSPKFRLNEELKRHKWHQIGDF